MTHDRPRPTRRVLHGRRDTSDLREQNGNPRQTDAREDAALRHQHDRGEVQRKKHCRRLPDEATDVARPGAVESPLDEREHDERKDEPAALKAEREEEAEPEDDDGVEGRELADRPAECVNTERSDGGAEQKPLRHEPGGCLAREVPGQVRAERAW